MADTSSETGPPLSAAILHLLLALATQDLHGYGILQEVGRVSGGTYTMGPGTLYDNLKKLLNLGWVTDYAEEDPGTDEKRRMYHLTEEGRKALEAEVARMKLVVRTANRILASHGGPA